jgi:metallophosphoesterase (TIGR00282 family)
LQNKARFLYVGDVMGSVGLELIESELPKLRLKEKIDFVLAQAENVSRGRGCTPKDFDRLKKAGVDFCTGGNWTLWEEGIIPNLSDPRQPIIRPANYPMDTPGLGYKYADAPFGKVLIISLLGKTVGRDSKVKLDNPLTTVDQILDREKNTEKVALIVNFHGDYSSEKVVIGHYLNGRVSAVIGDHWHVPTADARILSKGTAHITDVGMVGALDSSLGVKTDLIIQRWRDETHNLNELEEHKPWQMNGLIFEVDTRTARAVSVKALNLVYE